MAGIPVELLVLTLALSVVVGVTLGLLGGGGSILTVPVLVYVAGLDAKQAIATSLVVVGVTAAMGTVSHARAGRVRWRTGLLFGAAGLSGAFLGGLLGGVLPGAVLLVGFAVMMLVTAVAMLRGRGDVAPRQGDLPVLHVLGEGLVVGLVTGLVGAGGGFLVVPALVLLGGLPMSVAVGTSLLVIAMKSLGGLAGYLSSVQLDWALVAAVTAAAVVGSLVGGRLVSAVPEAALRRGFAWFVLVMGVFVLAQELPAAVVVPAGVVLAAVVASGTACWHLVSSCPLRRAVHATAGRTPRTA
ncbi:sulfite exporter TauE/SafE family protein [Nocardioidaceae bacterium]|nr:sulfite exporter TauE/SafE family protein [Nocardioidaceae bacterium]